MIPDEYNPETLKRAVKRGTLSDLRFASNFVDKLVDIVISNKDFETLSTGFESFRARSDPDGYHEDDTSQLGNIHFHPVTGKDIEAPPPEKAKFGRFNLDKQPVLYLATSPEVALAECKALSTDICTIGILETTKPCKVAKFLRHQKHPLSVLLGEPTPESLGLWLLADMAEFLSRRVNDSDERLHYRVCNLIASAFSERGFDGIIYRSSFWSKGWNDFQDVGKKHLFYSSNIVLFDPRAAVAKHSYLANINWLRPIAESAGGSTWDAPE